MAHHSAPLPVSLTAYPWEIGWLLAALTGRPLPAIPADPASWEIILEAALRHRLAPLLWARLRERPEAAQMPAAFLERLRKCYLANAAKGMQHLQELGRVLQALDAAGIPTIVLKGACLAQEVYGNLALRVVGDADLVVPETMLAQAIAVLGQLGYQSGFDFDLDTEKTRHHHIPALFRPGGIAVELHWTLAVPELHLPFGEEDMCELWNRARPIQLGRATTLMLAPEDLLLHLCLHAAAQHLFLVFGMRSLFDLAEAQRVFGATMAWEQVIVRARRWGIERPVYLALLLTAQLTGVPMQQDILDALRPAELTDTLVRQAISNVTLTHDPSLTSTNFVALGIDRSFGTRTRVLFESLFPRPAELARKYPARADSWRLYLCYPARWIYLLRRYGTQTGSLVRGDDALREAVYGQDALAHWLRPNTCD